MNLTKILVLVGSSALLTAFTVPFYRRLFRRHGWVDVPGGRKIHAEAVALSGGASVLTGLLVFLLLGWVFCASVLPFFSEGEGDVMKAWCLGTVAFAVLGWIDDRLELGPAAKLGGQLIIVLGYLGSTGALVSGSTLQGIGFVLFMLASVNAFNFLDNMNGLCAGLGFISSVQLGLIAGNFQPLLAFCALGLAGAILGFLPFNVPRASVFLGDAGSHLIGFSVASLALAVRWPQTNCPMGPWLPSLLMVAVPFLDLVWVVMIRCRLGQPIYVGDTNHVSHYLVRWGLSPIVAVALLWFAALLASSAAWWCL